MLTQAAKTIGLQVPLLCILVAAVSVIQSITPYLVAQARLVPTFFIVLEQIVLMPIRATQGTTHRRPSSESDSSNRLVPSGPPPPPDTLFESGEQEQHVP